MKPNFFVFCEGDSEVAYVETVRQHYRLPIHIIAKKTLLNITSSLVERCKSEYIETPRDRTYLMYDLDVPSMLDRLQKVPDATLLCSNPCLELWLLLHYSEQRTELSSQQCVKKIGSHIKNYKKGIISLTDKLFLMNNVSKAVERAKKLNAYDNPSSSIFLLIEDLENFSY